MVYFLMKTRLLTQTVYPLIIISGLNFFLIKILALKWFFHGYAIRPTLPSEILKSPLLAALPLVKNFLTKRCPTRIDCIHSPFSDIQVRFSDRQEGMGLQGLTSGALCIFFNTLHSQQKRTKSLCYAYSRNHSHSMRFVAGKNKFWTR